MEEKNYCCIKVFVKVVENDLSFQVTLEEETNLCLKVALIGYNNIMGRLQVDPFLQFQFSVLKIFIDHSTHITKHITKLPTCRCKVRSLSNFLEEKM